MSLPIVAIVGRPNVGKSSLLNRLARRRVSIVDPTPGVTRDRVSTVIEVEAPMETPKGTPSKLIELMDTGGFGVYVAEGKRFDDVGADLATLTESIETQIKLAVDQASLILFVVDAQAGITALDETVADLLRKSGHAKKVLLVSNKTDGDHWEPYALEATALGLGDPVMVSAESGFRLRTLGEAIWERIPETSDEESDAERAHSGELKLAIVGKRNAGKSSFVNALAGAARVIVSEIAGTTRDSVDVRFEIDGRTMTAIDTAGLRKRKSMSEDVEYYAFRRALAAIRRADVALLLIDATEPVSQVDQQLAMELQRQFKPTVLVVNKWDLVDPKQATPEDYGDYLTKHLRGFDFAPIVFVSATTGGGVRDAVAMAFNLHQQASHRETTGKLNQVVGDILKARGPSTRLGTQAKLFYATQIDVHPPTLVLMVNDAKLFGPRYERYLLNRLREELPFSEVPVRLIFRSRKRVALNELKHRPRHGDGGIGGGDDDGDLESEI